EAEKLYREAMTREQRVYGPDGVSTTQARLGNLLRQQGKLAEAERLLECSLTTSHKEGAVSTDYIRGLLAYLREDQGRLADAEKLHRQQLDSYLRKYGPHHPVTLRARADLGLNWQQQGKLKEAEALFRTLVEEWRQLRGADSLDALTALR